MSFLDNIEQTLAFYPLLAFGMVFLTGALSSASPCVLATMPLAVGYVGGYAGGDRGKAFLFSLSFVIGLSLTFTALGAAAAWFGTLFGTLGGPWYFAVGVLALALGGQMMGLYTIPMPTLLNIEPRRRGLAGAFLLGLLVGAVSSPCATPVLVVLLAYVATQGQMLYGMTLLFIYALGHCLLMLLAGTFTGFIEVFAESRGVTHVSTWAQRLGGALVALTGGYLIWNV